MRKMKSRILILSAVILGLNLTSLAQVEQCGTMKLLKEHLAADPGLQEQMRQTEINAQAWTLANKKTSSTVVTIPTVVHVIHNTSTPDQNIPDSVIISQIEVLNEDFRRMNTDAANTRAIFDSIAADVEVEFCLASFDPSGNPITGINRVPTTQTGFEIFGAGMNDMKYTANGGADAWPRDQYLNLWVCNMTVFGFSGSILGFAQFPGDVAATDGVVIQYNFMGRTTDPVQSDSSTGRTATHEVGHWLGLRHTWADDDTFGNGTCDSSDFIDDTPNQMGRSNYDCDTIINSCSNEAAYWGTIDPPDMVENYMDYSSDECSNMFSMGQKTRMLSFLNTDRLPLLSSSACASTETLTMSTCIGTCMGVATVSIMDATPPYTYLWSDPMAQTTSTASGLCVGTYTVVTTDGSGLSIFDTLTIDTPAVPLSANVIPVDASCDTCIDGYASISASGGSGVYSVAWTDTNGMSLDPVLGLSPGTYVGIITDACGEQVIDTFNIQIWTSVEKQITPLNFEMYPNPSSGFVTMRFELPQKNIQIQVVDALGKTVFESKINGSATLDLSNLNSGVYVVRATSEGSIISKRLLLFK